MMKTACKRYSFAGFSMLSIAAVVMPLSVSAATFEERQAEREENRQERAAEMKANREERVAERQENRQEAFCNRFTENAEKIASNLAERRGKFEDRRENRANTLETRRDGREAKLDGNRTEADERRSAMYARLEARATTDAQKAAVAEFKKTVEEAVDTRRDAVDAAIAEFRKGVDAAIAGRKDDMESAVSQFQSEVVAALGKAKSDCADGANPETVKTNFRNSLAAARTALQNDRKDADKVGEQVKKLAETRRIAVRKALDDFRSAVEAARVELKKAFGEASP
ncbi:MAG: hypothetical protein AAB547_00800 [Patescibacteria group bacterium]